MTDEKILELVQKSLKHEASDEETLLLAKEAEKVFVSIQRQLTELLSVTNDADQIRQLQAQIKNGLSS